MEIPSRYRQCARQFCNLWQSQEERREKYDYCRALGVSSYMAKRLRDWRMEHILHYFTILDAHNRIALQRLSQPQLPPLT